MIFRLYTAGIATICTLALLVSWFPKFTIGSPTIAGIVYCAMAPLVGALLASL